MKQIKKIFLSNGENNNLANVLDFVANDLVGNVFSYMTIV